VGRIQTQSIHPKLGKQIWARLLRSSCGFGCFIDALLMGKHYWFVGVNAVFS